MQYHFMTGGYAEKQENGVNLVRYDPETAKRYASYMLKQIKTERERHGENGES